MKFITIKKRGTRKNKTPAAAVYYIEKTNKFGDVISQIPIRNSKDILIIGQAASGKTRYLNRLNERASEVWKRKYQPVYISARMALADWVNNKDVALWWNSKLNEETEWKKLNQTEKASAMKDYLSETRAILFVDNLDILTGKKLEIVKGFLVAASIFVGTTTDEGRISASLRFEVLQREPQMIRLASETAYDATPILFWLLMLTLLVMGAYEAAIALGVVSALGRGKGATKQS
jgi:hypothetical protein